MLSSLFSFALFGQQRPARDVIGFSSGLCSCNIEHELGPRLSSGAVIVTPALLNWAQLQERSSYPRVHPDYCAAVEVATEQDVQETIKFATANQLPFLVVSGAHGWTNDISKVQGGVQINMRRMNSISLSEDRKTATVGGGTLQDEIVKELASKNRLAVTGLCGCTSFIGPLMGSGHSVVQGQYGFAADNLNSARVVLGNGTAVDVSSTSNPDLFWAMRGAGHNFGVVTSFNVNVYPSAANEWSMLTFGFTEDKMEDVLNAINEITESNGGQDPKLGIMGNFARVPVMDPNNPVVLYILFYQGSVDKVTLLAAPLYAAGPVATTKATGIDYGNLFDTAGLGISGPVCRKNHNFVGYAASVATWNTTAMRTVFEYFSELTADSTFNTSVILLENLGTQGVRSADIGATSVASEERQDAILAAPAIWWQGDDADATAKAQDFGIKIQDAINAGRPSSAGPRHVYVNYAIGTESIPDVYGYDVQRVDKLKALKKQWDPENRFGFYAPLA